MKALVLTAIGIGSLWLQLTVVPMLALFGYQPNLMLLTVIVIGVLWLEPWLFLYAVLAGLAFDAFSHGILGVYAFSFFGVSFLARWAGVMLYENSLLLGAAIVFGLSLVEGLLSLTLLQLLDAGVPWWRWLAAGVLPTAVVNAVWSPLVLLAVGRLERLVRLPEP